MGQRPFFIKKKWLFCAVFTLKSPFFMQICHFPGTIIDILLYHLIKRRFCHGKEANGRICA